MQETHSNLSYQSFRNCFLALTPMAQAGFFLWPSVNGYHLTEEEKTLFSAIKPSGVVLFKRNFDNIEQSKTLIAELSKRCDLPKTSAIKRNFIVSADEEGGRVSRLPLGQKTKPVFEFSQNKDKEGLKKQVLLQINIAHAIGVNCILAPVLDIFTEPNNKVIGDRSFGTTPQEASEYASIVYETLEKKQIFSCAKHFPGHGNTKTDSHIDFAISDANKEILQKREWLPFKDLILKKIPMIMAAHVILPNLNSMDPSFKHHDKFSEDENEKNVSNNIPATLNFNIMTDILRNELGFEGLILSDDLRMGAIKKYYEKKGVGEKDYLAHACIDAMLAGCDILLSCHSIVDEKIIIDTLAEKMQKDADFFELCCHKAYRLNNEFLFHFPLENHKREW